MPKIDMKSIPERKGSGYPAPFHEPCIDRVRQALGDAGGLTQFGVNVLTLAPGAWSSQRHWHTKEDEFVYVLSGELVLIDDQGEHILRPGDCAAFPKNDGNGHHLVNRSSTPAICLEVGSRIPDDGAFYSDIDMKIERSDGLFTHRDGTPYPKR
ncbi:MAG: cupin domain-containing protein [Alphaproteobacteria bacterium]|nr:cupin domain-containing protein [Alphaproteobacteria bacterium]MDE2109704.1 cupin domain-containing protein [Alphaproteobacteria bacterium]